MLPLFVLGGVNLGHALPVELNVYRDSALRDGEREREMRDRPSSLPLRCLALFFLYCLDAPQEAVGYEWLPREYTEFFTLYWFFILKKKGEEKEARGGREQ